MQVQEQEAKILFPGTTGGPEVMPAPLGVLEVVAEEELQQS
jgi:hypothetical protein